MHTSTGRMRWRPCGHASLRLLQARLQRALKPRSTAGSPTPLQTCQGQWQRPWKTLSRQKRQSWQQCLCLMLLMAMLRRGPEAQAAAAALVALAAQQTAAKAAASATVKVLLPAAAVAVSPSSAGGDGAMNAGELTVILAQYTCSHQDSLQDSLCTLSFEGAAALSARWLSSAVLLACTNPSNCCAAAAGRGASRSASGWRPAWAGPACSGACC